VIEAAATESLEKEILASEAVTTDAVLSPTPEA
jgi:hypothetical protein